jgi:colanic acid/amylovoran biosynthesis glycosyltransferase
MSGTFLILSNVLGIQRPNGKLVLAGRLISGALEMGRHWKGQLTVAVEPAPESELEKNRDRTLGGDNVEVGPGDLPFKVEVARFDSPELERLLAASEIAAGGLNYRQTHLSRWARRAGVPFIYITEYTFLTYLQILFAEHADNVKRAKSSVWHAMVEAKQRLALLAANGLQCNGVPTYNAYRRLCPSTILYFDGRTTEEMLIARDLLDQRLDRLMRGGKLRLGFSGRLNKMKGGDELILVARALRDRGLDFQLKIWGGGVLADAMREDVQRFGLSSHVELCGYVKFEELVGQVQREVDVFLCCHPQGDPSGAYMEAFANGQPIAGYANEALSGLLGIMPFGVSAPIRDRERLADAIVKLDRDRSKIAGWAKEAVKHAAHHTFDKTFRRRMQHVEQVLIQSPRRHTT